MMIITEDDVRRNMACGLQNDMMPNENYYRGLWKKEYNLWPRPHYPTVNPC